MNYNFHKDGGATLHLATHEQTLLKAGHGLRQTMQSAAGEVLVTVNLTKPQAGEADALLAKLCGLARDYHQTDEVEIDPLEGWDDTSTGEDGVWVRAWAFLSHELLEEHGIPFRDFPEHVCEER